MGTPNILSLAPLIGSLEMFLEAGIGNIRKKRITKALKENHVIPDFRSPNTIRLAPVALYCSYSDVWNVVQILKTIMVEKQYEKFAKGRNVVA
jgi:kynureninase